MLLSSKEKLCSKVQSHLCYYDISDIRSSERAAFLFGGDRLLHVINLFYFFVYVGHPSSGLRGAVHSALFRRAGRDYCCVT